MQNFNRKNATTLPPLPNAIPLAEPTDDAEIEASFGEMAAGDHARIKPISTLQPKSPRFRIRSLRHGCYMLRYTPNSSFLFAHYDGTLRVERNLSNTTASGDLYIHRPFCWPPRPVVEPGPTRIPIYPRSRYRYYMRVTQILEWVTFGNSFTLGYDLYRFDQGTGSWTDQGAFTARMTWGSAPSGYPGGTDYLTGDVKNGSGTVVGALRMAWVSPYLRRAVIEIDRVSQSEIPETSGYEDGDGADIGWRHVFRQVGWNISVVESDLNLQEPSGESWSDSELHQKMLEKRDSADLDSEWRYHLLCVRRLDSASRGIMYDAYGGDSNNIPREGAGISSHWVFPDIPKWGNVAGQRFGSATAPYFRTAVHELGHAMGLYHNSVDNGFMNTTGIIASRGTAGNPFPDNVQWSFNPDDEKRLRHMPDPWVRPGMVPFGGSYSATPISPDDMVAEVDGVRIDVSPLLESVPIGAPVRVDIELHNNSGQPIPAPARLNLKSGYVSGTVTDPAGTVRTFWPLVRCVDEDEVEELEDKGSVSHSLTLLRGPEGTLFPSSGVYQVSVDVDWHIGEYPVRVSGRANFMVMPAVDEAHSNAALKVLSTPDALLTLVLGGDHLSEGNDAIQTALANPVLRPHYSVIEAKRLGRRVADIKEAASLIDEKTIVTEPEFRSWSDIVKPSAENDAYKTLIDETEDLLQKRVKEIIGNKPAQATVEEKS